MIRLEDITTEHFEQVSFEIKEGAVCKLITNSDYEKHMLLDVIFAIQQPISGRVFLFGADIYSLSEKERMGLFKRIGMVWSNGGLISNLKVWENIMLPLAYHTGKRPEDIEESVMGIFSEMGRDREHLQGYMGRLIGPMPVHEKRLIALIRAMLMEPELMIYDTIFEGLNPGLSSRLAKLVEKFHSERQGRTSLYISSDEQSLKDINADIVLRQEGRKGFS